LGGVANHAILFLLNLMESIINHVMLVQKTTMKEVKKQKPFPEVPEEAIVEPEQERAEAIDVSPEQVDGKDEAEYEQMKSADYDMDGDDNPDVNPEV
jgi:hypothetical protein